MIAKKRNPKLWEAAKREVKAEGNKQGKQFVKQPDKIAKKTAKYR